MNSFNVNSKTTFLTKGSAANAALKLFVTEITLKILDLVMDSSLMNFECCTPSKNLVANAALQLFALVVCTL